MAGANSAKHFESVHFGKIEIEDYRTGRRSVRVILGPLDERDGQLAVCSGMNIDEDTRLFDGFTHQKGIGQVVFNEQNSGPGFPAVLLRIGGW